jgi:transcription elongation factor Elf1
MAPSRKDDMPTSFQILDACPECGHEILVDVTPVDDHPGIGAGNDLEIAGAVCSTCQSIIGGQAEVTLHLETWSEADG